MGIPTCFNFLCTTSWVSSIWQNFSIIIGGSSSSLLGLFWTSIFQKNPHVLNIFRLRKKKPQKIPGAKLPMSLSGIVSKLTNSVSVFGYKNYKMASGTNFGSMQKIALVCQIPAQNRQNSFVVQKTVSYKVVSILKNFKVMLIFWKWRYLLFIYVKSKSN